MQMKKTIESKQQVFREYDPHSFLWSLDEASLEVTEACRDRGMSVGEIAQEIRARVCQVTGGLTCSVGIAPNSMLAKVGGGCFGG